MGQSRPFLRTTDFQTYRSRAEEHVHLADEAKDTAEREAHLAIAEGYLALAKNEEWLSGNVPPDDEAKRPQRDGSGDLRE